MSALQTAKMHMPGKIFKNAFNFGLDVRMKSVDYRNLCDEKLNTVNSRKSHPGSCNLQATWSPVDGSI